MDENKLVEFLLANNIDYKERDSSVTLLCPKCQKWKLDIHKDELNFICYYCAEKDEIPLKGWHAASILSEITSIPKEVVKRRLSGQDSNITIENFLEEEKPKEIIVQEHTEVRYPEGYFSIAADISKPGLEYMTGRGVCEEQSKELKLRFASRFQQVVFPVYHKDILVGYQGRCIDPDVPKERSKYNLPGFKKADYLMFEQTIKGISVVLCEGPVSAMKFYKCDIGYVATMGKYVSQQQMQMLYDVGVRNIYLGLDPDAWKETKKLILKYMSDFTFHLLTVPANKEDFGACTYEEASLSYMNAEEVNQFNLELLENQRFLKGM